MSKAPTAGSSLSYMDKNSCIRLIYDITSLDKSSIHTFSAKSIFTYVRYFFLDSENKFLSIAPTSNPCSTEMNSDASYLVVLIKIKNGDTTDLTTYTLEDTEAMIEKSSTVTEYEQYGVMPSPDYPSEVRACGDNVNILPTDEKDWEQGTINPDTGLNMERTTVIRTKNYININNLEDYYGHIYNNDYCFINLLMYKEDGTFIDNYYRKVSNAINGSKNIKFDFSNVKDISKIKVILKKIDGSNITNQNISEANAKIEKGSVATAYSEFGKGNATIIADNGLETTDSNYQSQEITVPIQEEMLEGDTFIKENEVWYEKHNWKNANINGVTSENFSGYMQVSSAIGNDLIGIVCGAKNKKINGDIISENLSKKVLGSVTDTTNIENVRFNEGIASHTTTPQIVLSLKKSRLSSSDLSGVLNYLKSNNINVWYELETPLLLPCTQEQTQELDKLDNLHTYKNITNIYSTDEVAPIVNAKYRKDIETLFNNINTAIVAMGGV